MGLLNRLFGQTPPEGAPRQIAINHDDYHARHIGRLPDGRQFLLTTPFVPARNADPGREFIALYLFDKRGGFLEALIDDLGPRNSSPSEDVNVIYERRLAELGPVEFTRIEVQPFQVDRFGVQFGLIPRPPEDDDDPWAVELLPGNYMAFFEPWDSGDYDT